MYVRESEREKVRDTQRYTTRERKGGNMWVWCLRDHDDFTCKYLLYVCSRAFWKKFLYIYWEKITYAVFSVEEKEETEKTKSEPWKEKSEYMTVYKS